MPRKGFIPRREAVAEMHWRAFGTQAHMQLFGRGGDDRFVDVQGVVGHAGQQGQVAQPVQMSGDAVCLFE